MLCTNLPESGSRPFEDPPLDLMLAFGTSNLTNIVDRYLTIVLLRLLIS